jgi:hypothetical protein
VRQHELFCAAYTIEAVDQPDPSSNAVRAGLKIKISSTAWQHPAERAGDRRYWAGR